MADIGNYQSLFGTGGELWGGIRQANKADEELAKLKAIPGYGQYDYLTGQEIYDQANAKATGLTPEEKAAAQQGMNRIATQRYRLASDRNPTLAGVIQSGINYGSVQGVLGLAAQDAAVRRQSLNSLIGLIGNQANLQESASTGLEIDTLKQLGLAKQAGLTNAHNSKETIRNSILSFWGGGSKSAPRDNGQGDMSDTTDTGGGFGTSRTNSGWDGMGDNSSSGFGGMTNREAQDLEYYKQKFPNLFR